MAVNLTEVEKLAKLARLDLTVRQKVNFVKEISSILQYVGQLQEMKIAADEAVSTEFKPVLREDAVLGQAAADQLKLIQSAPQQQDNLIKTQPVF